MRDYLWLYQERETPVSEPSVIAVIEKYGIRAACLSAAGEDEIRELSMEELLLDERISQNGMLLDRELLRESGGVNTRLPAKWEYELALRVVQQEKLFLLPFAAQKEENTNDVNAQTAWDAFCVDAYIAGRYRDTLKEWGMLEAVLEAVLAEGLAVKDTDAVQEFLEVMLAHTGRYFYYYDATQPILIYRNTAGCYNILNIFADELAEALSWQGNRIEFYDTETEDVKGLARLLGKRYKASVGFQAWILSGGQIDDKCSLMDRIGGPKYNFVLDHPIWLQEQLRNVPKRYYVLTHDRNYAAFIRKYDTGVENVYLLPPGGREMQGGGGGNQEISEKRYDVTFLGTYGNYREKLADIAACTPEIKFLAARFLLYMKQSPNSTAEASFQRALEHYGICLKQEEFLRLFGGMGTVIQCIMYYYREKAVEAIVKSGIELHVFGDSWKKSPFAQNPFLKMHEAVYGKAALRVLERSKISLNIMAWHKDGFTERIADSMLAGAVVVSDYSRQLEEFWREETVLFDLSKVDRLPDILARLLKDENGRRRLAKAAEEKARTTAAWSVRAKELLQMIEEEAMKRQEDF